MTHLFISYLQLGKKSNNKENVHSTLQTHPEDDFIVHANDSLTFQKQLGRVKLV